MGANIDRCIIFNHERKDQLIVPTPLFYHIPVISSTIKRMLVCIHYDVHRTGRSAGTGGREEGGPASCCYALGEARCARLGKQRAPAKEVRRRHTEHRRNSHTMEHGMNTTNHRESAVRADCANVYSSSRSKFGVTGSIDHAPLALI